MKKSNEISPAAKKFCSFWTATVSHSILKEGFRMITKRPARVEESKLFAPDG